MINVTTFPHSTILAADLLAAASSLRSMKEPLHQSVKQVMVPSIRQNFDVGGRPPWAELAQVTLDKKAAQGFPDTILVRTGKLRRKAAQINAWTITKDEATMRGPVDVPYWEEHDLGTRHMPARPWAKFQEEDVDDIERIFRTWVEGRLRSRRL